MLLMKSIACLSYTQRHMRAYNS